jgi:phosphate butyryltransferase
MRSFKEITREAKGRGPLRLVLAASQDEEAKEAIKRAEAEGITKGIFIEGKAEETAPKAVELVRNGKAGLLMKGALTTAQFMHPILDKEKGLTTGRLLSHVAVFEFKNRLILASDAAINIFPKLKEKKGIIKNAIELAHLLGIQKPKVALLAPIEKVTPKIPITQEAIALKKMEWKGAIIDGPLALDNTISIEAAKKKGIKSPVAGRADILILPNITSGNIFYKSLIYFAKVKMAGVVMGAKVPIVLTSRADSKETKFLSIALGALMAKRKG